MSKTRASLCLSAACLLAMAAATTTAHAQKVYLNPSDQTSNPVSGGGNEAQYALINANIAEDILDAAGFDARVDQDFDNAPSNANSWGADIFVSIHTNAGGGHGIETLYKSTGGETLAGHINDGLLASLPYQNRGLKYRDNLHVLNATNMYACLTEALFHDCTASSGYQGHPPSESSFLRSADGQQKIGTGIARGVCIHYGKTCGSGTVPTKGWLKGVVYRAPNLDDRIEGAFVQVESGPSSTTGATGDFAFELDAATYTVTATMTGFKPGSSTRAVLAGQDVWGSIGLEPETPVPEPVPEAGPDVDVSFDGGAEASEGGWPTPAQPGDGGGAAAYTASDDSSGCGCRLEASRRSSRYWLWIAGAALGVAAARRRRFLG